MGGGGGCPPPKFLRLCGCTTLFGGGPGLSWSYEAQGVLIQNLVEKN